MGIVFRRVASSWQNLSTRRLFAAGLVAGPLVLAVGFAQAFLREGFDLRRNASSQLALGELGWVQSLNFIVAGMLTLAFAIGARRVLRSTPGGFWAPLLLGGIGFNALMVACFVLAWHFGRQQWRWMAFSLFAGASIAAVAVYGGSWEMRHTDPAVRAVSRFDFLPTWLSLPVVWGYLMALAWKLRQTAGIRP